MRFTPARRIGLLFLMAGVAATGGRAAAQPARAADLPGTRPQPLISWFDLSSTQPLALTFEHDIELDPSPSAPRRVIVHRSQWQLGHLRIRAFGGQTELSGRGDIAEGRPSDLSTTMTLQGVDVQRILRFLNVPRADEIQARVGGQLGVRVLAGEWDRLDVDLTAEKDSVRVSRRLLIELLSSNTGDAEIEKAATEAFNYQFGTSPMIPIDAMRIRGSLGQTRLSLSIPLSNKAMTIRFEPMVDRATLWEVWGLLQRAGLRDVGDIDWDIKRRAP
jgi:hypothetical protein